jgi:C_GCAxxG_C_C family probable redox protein
MSSDEAFRVMELGLQGFKCSQILALLALEAQENQNPDLVRAMTGLLSGYSCGKLCGALTGGCCVLGMYAGKDSAECNADPSLGRMLRSYSEWFETEYTPRYGGINCSDIVGDDARNQMKRCPAIVIECWDKLKELLAENDYDVSQPYQPGR